MVCIIHELYGEDEFITRIADPVWFQSLGTVLAFDWNASGLTTILTAALKEAIRGHERELGIFICGGKGKTSRKTPREILSWGPYVDLSEDHFDKLVYNSKMSAKVDSSLVQDGYQIYHHAFFFTTKGAWAVVQQGMNTLSQTARRYHWSSSHADDLICEPHTGIASTFSSTTLDLTSRKSERNRTVSIELTNQSYHTLMKDVRLIRSHSNHLSRMMSVGKKDEQLTLLELEGDEFSYHPVIHEDFSKSTYLDKVLYEVIDQKPQTYEELIGISGVGPKTMRALSLVAEVIYGASPSYEDPARYSFAHGGKDGSPYPVDRPTYDKSIEFFKKVIDKLALDMGEKKRMHARLQSNSSTHS